MRIAVIGSGNIGGTLARAWAKAGHDVAIGSRNHGEPAADGPAEVDIATALNDAEAVLLAIPARAVAEFLETHASALDGTLVIDATNNVGAAVANAASAIAEATPGARYVRAFNTLGWENFANPSFAGVAADLFFSGPEADEPTVAALIADVGLRPAYLGPDKADVVDHALPLWFALSQRRGQRRLAFRVLSD